MFTSLLTSIHHIVLCYRNKTRVQCGSPFVPTPSMVVPWAPWFPVHMCTQVIIHLHHSPSKNTFKIRYNDSIIYHIRIHICMYHKYLDRQRYIIWGYECGTIRRRRLQTIARQLGGVLHWQGGKHWVLSSSPCVFRHMSCCCCIYAIFNIRRGEI